MQVVVSTSGGVSSDDAKRLTRRYVPVDFPDYLVDSIERDTYPFPNPQIALEGILDGFYLRYSRVEGWEVVTWT